MRGFFFIVGTILLLSACAAPWSEQGHEFRARRAQAKTICEIMARPDRYAGKRLLVRGTYGNTPHQRILFDSNCERWEIAVELHNFVKWREPARETRVIYSGVFTSSRYLTPCDGPECFRYSLKDARLVGTY